MPLRIGDIAIVGMACRFPGVARTPGEFWEILQSGRDVVGDVGSDRWSTDYYFHGDRKQPGKSYTFSAGLIDGVEAFDAQFFGISPREAAQMDPQQRLLLELAWEALEDAGQVPAQLAGSDCSVFVGISSPDFISSRIEDLSTLDAYSMTGGSLSIAANRISYCLDFRGPSLSIDTACSSSLVALHQACQSIRRGESSSSLVGGVNVLLSPFGFIGFSRASMLSPSGRCRAFDAAADGYVRAEGGAVLFLKPLARARADGDNVYAVILDTVVNSDGHTHGLSLPSTSAQEALLRTVYGKAGVEPDSLAYLEAHGTGTIAGDPQEAGAIGRAIAMHRSDENPLPIGSVKTNIGHLEAGSGLAGVVKVVMSLQHRAIPASLHFQSPNPAIPFSELNLQVASEFTPLPSNGSRLVMGVNSFGFGGANAHAILAEYPVAKKRRPARAPRSLPPLFISARSQTALEELAAAYADSIEAADPSDYYNLAYTAGIRRQQHNHRLAMPARPPAAMAGRLREFSKHGRATGVVNGQVIAMPARVALLFSGNGSQWPGMGCRLLTESRVFRRAVEEVDALVQPLAGFSVMDELEASPDASRLHLTEVAQPALFALQVGVLEVLLAKGLQPGAVFGHSVGEITAAYAAGALSLEQAALTIYARSAAQASTRGRGRMAAVAMSPSEAVAALAASDGEVELAAVNSPESVTLSGTLAGLQALEARLEPRGVFFRILDLDYAFHSGFMEPVRAPLLQMLADLEPSATELPYVSTVTGTVQDGKALGADYWYDNIRQPVRLDRATETLASKDTYLYLEIGPHPILQGYIQENLSATGRRGRSLASLKKNDDGEDRLTETLLTSHVLGVLLDAGKLFSKRGRCVSLPRYAWQRENHWYPSTDELTRLLKPRGEHPLLGFRVPHVDRTWENLIDTVRFSYLADHVVGGAVVFPASAFIEMALAAAEVCATTDNRLVEKLEIRSPLVFGDGQSMVVRFSLAADDHRFTIRSRSRFGDDRWTLNVVGRLASWGSTEATEPGCVDVSVGDGSSSFDSELHYQIGADRGLFYGPAFRAVANVRSENNCALATIVAPAEVAADLGDYRIHPVILDACLQSLLGILAGQDDQQQAAYLPQQLARFELSGDGATIRYCRVTIKRHAARSVVADFELADMSGNVVAKLDGFRFRRMPLAGDGTAAPSLYEARAILKPSVDSYSRAPVPHPSVLAQLVKPLLESEWWSLRRDVYYEQVVPLLDALVSAFAVEALRSNSANHHAFTLDSLMQASGISATQSPLLQRLLSILEEDGIAERTESGWVMSEDVGLPDSRAIWRRILADFPAHLPELTIAGRCGMHLAAILRGERDAASLLTPPRGVAASDHLFKNSQTIRIMCTMLRDVVERIVRSWPSGRRMRILELVGASSVVATELLPLLPQNNCDYLIAATDDATCRRLLSDFAAIPCTSAVVLDVSADLSEQDVPHGAFDMVIAPYVLHAAGDPSTPLANIRQLLAAEGLLLLLERGRNRLVDLAFGIDPGWWQQPGVGAEGARSATLPLASWPAALEANGFVEVESLTEPVPLDVASSCLFVARNPSRYPATDATATDAPRRILLISDAMGDSREVSERMTGSLCALGHEVVSVRVAAGFRKLAANAFECGLQNPGDFAQLCAVLESDDLLPREVIQLAGLSLQHDVLDVDLRSTQDRRCVSTVHLLQAMLAARWSVTPRLWLVTCGATVPECGDPESMRQVPSQSPLWGLGRVLMNEHPEFDCKLVDLHVAYDPVVAAGLLVRELRELDGEDEILLTADRRYAMRAWPATLDPVDESLFKPDDVSDAEMTKLDYPSSGFDNLRWQRGGLRTPGAGEITIRTRATGLNFRDVMISMGMLSDEALENGFAGANLGMECAGDVVSVGTEVSEFKPGDPVICFAPSSFGSHVVTRALAAVHKPAAWTYEEGASVPVAFFTAYYALHHLGALHAGNRVLIHGAAGGVGIAAIQYARYCGAEIFATAGSEEKRDFLRLLGVHHVLDSRSLVFGDEIAAITEGEGVDVVLNSLSGEAVLKNLEVLRPFGRFLELGKRDYYDNAKVELRPFRNNITYFGIDVDQLFKERPDLAGRLFHEVMDLFSAGVFRPLPHRTFANVRTADAFRHMQQSRHIGKIVVAYDDRPMLVASFKVAGVSLTLKPDATYLIAGGLGGVGLATARWMVEKGARYLVLLGRRGAVSDESRETVAELQAAGVVVNVVKVDIADTEGLREVLDDIEVALPPLRGIVHAAMVIDDGLIQGIDRTRMSQVLAPKVSGAWNLHRLTLGKTLDFFILYSSVTTSVGNPGQGSYVAANMFLECLAGYRRERGLPALAVSWGPIDDVGYLARNEALKKALTSRTGGQALTSRVVFRMLERLLSADRSGLAVANLDWRKLAHDLPAVQSPRFEVLTRGLAADAAGGGQAEDIQRLIDGMSLDQVRELTTTILLEQMADVVRLQPDQVDVDRSVFDLGMDSLMAVELQAAIESRFGVHFPAMAMNESTSIAQLSGQIARRLTAGDGDADSRGPDSDQEFLASLNTKHGHGLTDEELKYFAEDVADSKGTEL